MKENIVTIDELKRFKKFDEMRCNAVRKYVFENNNVELENALQLAYYTLQTLSTTNYQKLFSESIDDLSDDEIKLKTNNISALNYIITSPFTNVLLFKPKVADYEHHIYCREHFLDMLTGGFMGDRADSNEFFEFYKDELTNCEHCRQEELNQRNWFLYINVADVKSGFKINLSLPFIHACNILNLEPLLNESTIIKPSGIYMRDKLLFSKSDLKPYSSFINLNFDRVFMDIESLKSSS